METSKIESASSQVKELYKTAIMVRSNAYVPYSGCQVGAAIQLSNGKIYSGCNVENSSYGATVCAERVAVQKAVSEQGHVSITSVMVVTDASPAWPPCGICRQVIAEFGPKSTIYLANLKGEFQTLPFIELFPQAFTPEYLQK
jgi:cytidine deaminase